jgi:hypothetical protein
VSVCGPRELLNTTSYPPQRPSAPPHYRCFHSRSGRDRQLAGVPPLRWTRRSAPGSVEPLAPLTGRTRTVANSCA